MSLAKKQVAIIWISLTVLIPVAYFAFSGAADLKQKEMALISVKQTEDVLLQRAGIVQQRRALMNKLGVFSFAWLSMTGLLVFLNHNKKT